MFTQVQYSLKFQTSLFQIQKKSKQQFSDYIRSIINHEWILEFSSLFTGERVSNTLGFQSISIDRRASWSLDRAIERCEPPFLALSFSGDNDRGLTRDSYVRNICIHIANSRVFLLRIPNDSGKWNIVAPPPFRSEIIC